MRHDMSQVNRTANGHEPLFHPVSHYDSPDDVLNDARLSTDEKRTILSSWASDMYVVESKPALREVPGIPNMLRLDDILAALKSLDADNDPPPRGGLPLRQPGFSRLDCIASDAKQNVLNRPAPTRRRRPANSSTCTRVGRAKPSAAVSQAPDYPVDRHRTQFHSAMARRVARWSV